MRRRRHRNRRVGGRRAREEGYIQIADIFEETANQECEHALRFFKFFNGGELEVTGSFPTGVIRDTYENLVAAADGERFEHQEVFSCARQSFSW